MHPNAQLLTDFYGAFARKDAAAMAACYADTARFHDPVFLDLDAAGVRAMWRMLIERGTDLELTFSGIDAGDASGRASWQATYTFQATGRRVHNAIDASFRFADGKIVEHTDSFGFWRWARMALGPTGVLLGWTPLVRRKVQRMAARQLAKEMA